MLSEFSGEVYIALGYTDLRRGIDGLAAVVQESFALDPFTNTRACYGKATDFFCCINGWKPDHFNGQEQEKKPCS